MASRRVPVLSLDVRASMQVALDDAFRATDYLEVVKGHEPLANQS